jgi:UDP-N-acetylmuramoyl-tripeptide--D-alanyl-D-alanine ligase
LAQRYAAGFNCPKVAVTGSNGKTTTKDMIAAILRQAGPTLATEGNFNNHIGVPLTLFGLKKIHRHAVLELGMSHPGEIAPLSEIVAPRIAVITNVGYAHLEAFGTREAIGEEKLSIQKGLVSGGTLILNLDDPILAKARAPRGGRLVTFGIDRGQVRAQDLVMDGQGCASFKVGRTHFRIPVPGRHNVYNALAAIAVGIQLRIPKGAMAKALASFVPSKYRMQVRKLGEVTVIEDCYNANPTSVRSALSSLADFKVKGRRIAVLGDMLELGPQSEALHEEVGRYAAEMGLDRVVTFGAETRHLNRGARGKGMARTSTPHFQDLDLLVEEISGNLRAGDVMLIKGSRGMKMERLFESLKQKYTLGVLQAGEAR